MSSEVHPLVYPVEDLVENGQMFKINEIVRVIADWGTYDMERYYITEVIGTGDVAMYAVKGVNTGETFSYFGAEDFVRA